MRSFQDPQNASSSALWFILLILGCWWTPGVFTMAQIQDKENFSEIQIWFVQDDSGNLQRLAHSWNRAPYHLTSELMSDTEFVKTALKLSQKDRLALDRYLTDYFRKQNETDQSIWHYPQPGMDRNKLYEDWMTEANAFFERELHFLDIPTVEAAYQRYALVSLGFDSVLWTNRLFPKLALDDQQRTRILNILKSERAASSDRAASFHLELLENIERLLTDAQRQELQRLYADDLRSLKVPWELQSSQLEFSDSDARIMLLTNDAGNGWLTLPNTWFYRISGYLSPEKYVNPYLSLPKPEGASQDDSQELEALRRLLSLLNDPKMSDLLEISRRQEDELQVIQQSLSQFSQDTVEARFSEVQTQLVRRREIPDGPLSTDSWKKVREAYLNQTVAAQLRLLRPIHNVLIPQQHQQLETLQVKVETRAVGIWASFRWGLLGRSLGLSQKQLAGLDKLREIKRGQIKQTLFQEEDRFWSQLDVVWTADQREFFRTIRYDSRDFFQAAPGLLLLPSRPH